MKKAPKIDQRTPLQAIRSSKANKGNVASMRSLLKSYEKFLGHKSALGHRLKTVGDVAILKSAAINSTEMIFAAKFLNLVALENEKNGYLNSERTQKALTQQAQNDVNLKAMQNPKHDFGDANIEFAGLCTVSQLLKAFSTPKIKPRDIIAVDSAGSIFIYRKKSLIYKLQLGDALEDKLEAKITKA